jgi:hypothetical protein
MFCIYALLFAAATKLLSYYIYIQANDICTKHCTFRRVIYASGPYLGGRHGLGGLAAVCDSPFLEINQLTSKEKLTWKGDANERDIGG